MDNISTIETSSASIEALHSRKSALWKALLLSAGFDIVMSVLELPFDIEFFGIPIFIDEIVGFVLSKWLAGTTIDLKMRNRLIGLIPIPGVTAISYQCAIELWKIHQELKKLEANS